MVAITGKPEPNKYAAIASRNSRTIVVYATMSEIFSSKICDTLKLSQNRHVTFGTVLLVPSPKTVTGSLVL
jgi:hypothetical protein